MLGTLNGALEVRQVVLPPADISCVVEGVNELIDRIPVLTRITLHYKLRIPDGTRETVDRALSRHQDKCPTAQSLKQSVDISWTADIEEA